MLDHDEDAVDSKPNGKSIKSRRTQAMQPEGTVNAEDKLKSMR